MDEQDVIVPVRVGSLKYEELWIVDSLLIEVKRTNEN